MPKYQITGPDGQKFDVTAPDGASEQEVLAYAQRNFKMAAAPKPAAGSQQSYDDEAARYLESQRQERLTQARAEGNQTGRDIAMFVPNLAAGGLRGAGSIGATLVAPYDIASDALAGKGLTLASNRRRRADLDYAMESIGADTNSLGYGIGKLGGEIAGTAGVGGVAANGVRVAAPLLTRAGASAPAIERLATSVASSGFRTGAPAATTLPGKAADLALRSAGGAITGGASAALVDPDTAGTGAAIGVTVPGAAKMLGAIGGRVGSSLSGGGINPAVRDLALRAKQLGIDVPVDRIANSKPLNAVAAGLNYVPFSGRAATESKMQSQLNRALSRTFGQDSDNVTMALRKAQDQLGGEFDRVLRSNTVRIDSEFLNELADAEATAARELGQEGAGIISRQIDEIMSKGASGQIDGQTAYNIKKMLDRIGRRTTPEAHYATDLRKSLMGALDRSMTPEAAISFATTRKQYGNMLTLEKLAQNGADGDVSIARIANMKNINNADMQELADIAAQFLKPREGAHGAAQRAAAAVGLGALSGLPALAAGAGMGRATNMAMNSQTARNLMLRQGATGLPPELLEPLYRAAPVAGSQ